MLIFLLSNHTHITIVVAAVGMRQLFFFGTQTLDAVILGDFYNTVPAAGQSILTNWCGVRSAGVYVNDPCTGTSAWFGVTCSTSNRVTSVNLYAAGLRGGCLPISIGGLDALNTLNLNYNSLTGSIPRQLGLLTNLINLELYQAS